MPIYLRPDLLTIDPAEVSDYLDDLGIRCRTRPSPEPPEEPTALEIETDVDAADELAAFVPTSTIDRSVFPPVSDYRRPPHGEMKDHVPHIRDYRAAVRAGNPVTTAQTQHALADVIEALYQLNESLR